MTYSGYAIGATKEILMTAQAAIWKRKREDFKNARARLFKRYEKSPNDLCLALEIRIIDDQIAECTYQIEQESLKMGLGQGISLCRR